MLRFYYVEKIYPKRAKYSNSQHAHALKKFLKKKYELERCIPNKYKEDLLELYCYFDELEKEFGENMFRAGFSEAMKLSSEICTLSE